MNLYHCQLIVTHTRAPATLRESAEGSTSKCIHSSHCSAARFGVAGMLISTTGPAAAVLLVGWKFLRLLRTEAVRLLWINWSTPMTTPATVASPITFSQDNRTRL